MKPLRWEKAGSGSYLLCYYGEVEAAVAWAIEAACKPGLRISHSDFKEILNEAFGLEGK